MSTNHLFLAKLRGRAKDSPRRDGPHRAHQEQYTALIVPRSNGGDMWRRCLEARPWWRLSTVEPDWLRKRKKDASQPDDDDDEDMADAPPDGAVKPSAVEQGSRGSGAAASSAGHFNFVWSQRPIGDWSGFYDRPPGAPKQLMNRFRGNGSICIKDRLAINMKRYAKATKVDPKHPLPLLPQSFVITVAGDKTSGDKGQQGDEQASPGRAAGLQQQHKKAARGDNGLRADSELRAFREAAAAYKLKGEGMWIVKCPPLNRGRGIQVFASAKAVESYLKHRKPASTWVVRHRPLDHTDPPALPTTPPTRLRTKNTGPKVHRESAFAQRPKVRHSPPRPRCAGSVSDISFYLLGLSTPLT